MTTNEQTSFENLGILPRILNRLKELGYTTPTPIQHKAIPVAIEGKDVLGVAQTGTGKTLAFGIPLIQRILEIEGRGLIIVPTRELAIQVQETFEKFGKGGIKTALLIGGMSPHLQLRALKMNPEIIIATPGRLIDHLERKTLNLDLFHTLILDEADLMLDMGFMPQINKIVAKLPTKRQTMLFSATMPKPIEKLAEQFMKSPVRIEVSVQGSTPKDITQKVEYVNKESKVRVLNEVLTAHEGTAIVFVRTKHSAKKLCFELREMQYKAAEIHSDRSLFQRRQALDGFKSGRHRILVATDIAARGIDVSNIGLVVNFDMPENPEDYVHRIGRTGRAGQKGKAISFATSTQRRLVYQIERLTNMSLNSGISASSKNDAMTQSRRGSFSRGGQGGGRKTNYNQKFGYRNRRENARSGQRQTRTPFYGNVGML